MPAFHCKARTGVQARSRRKMESTRKAFLLQPASLHKKAGASAAEGEGVKLGKEEAELRMGIE